MAGDARERPCHDPLALPAVFQNNFAQSLKTFEALQIRAVSAGPTTLASVDTPTGHLVDSCLDHAALMRRHQPAWDTVRNRMSLRKTDLDPHISAFAVAQHAVPIHSLRSRSGHTVSHGGASRRAEWSSDRTTGCRRRQARRSKRSSTARDARAPEMIVWSGGGFSPKRETGRRWRAALDRFGRSPRGH